MSLEKNIAAKLGSAKQKGFLAGGGAMAETIESMDWATSPLGPVEQWPQSLRTTVSLCLASNFPISLIWGRACIQIYNDGYWPICGGKHPGSMGQDFRECWHSAWPAIGEAFDRAQAGRTSYIENARMFLDRNGYLEETFFTFSFSPIRDEDGNVAGVFHPVTETTAQMLSERRMRALRDLAGITMKAKSAQQACQLAAAVLANFDLDLPFVLFYLCDEDVQEAVLAGSSGLQNDGSVIPARVILSGPETEVLSDWPFREALRSSKPMLISDLARRFSPLSCGPYPEPLQSAFVLPIPRHGSDRFAGLAVAGISTRLALDDNYRGFFDLLVGHVATALANVRAYEEERKRAEALAQIDLAKTAFFSNVSHEFRTPLTLLLGPLEDILGNEESLPGRSRSQIQLAYRNGLRLQKLVNSLLDFSRIEAGRIQAIYEAVDLARLTTELASNFQSAFDKAGLRLVVDCPALRDSFYVDREMWEKITLNLLSNAFKFTFDGSVTVSLRMVEHGAELCIADTGIGIAQNELAHVFERFHRVEGARGRTFEGSGIGLALVHELVKLHSGSVRVESELERGSTFTVFIPSGASHLPKDRIGAARELSSTALRSEVFVEESLRWLPGTSSMGTGDNSYHPRQPLADSGSEGAVRSRLLVADDNSDMRDYLERLLSSRYDVMIVSNGEEALDAAREFKPDLVLTDVMMPRTDGFELLRRIRADPGSRTIPVILLSARAGQEARVEGLDAGADDYLIKPFTARELLARVNTHVEMGRVRKEALEAVRRGEREREALIGKLERSNQELARFSFAVWHDMQAPIDLVRALTHSLGGRGAVQTEDEREKVSGFIERAARGMDRLIRSLLRYAQIGEGSIEKRAIPLNNVLDAVRATLSSRIAETGTDVICRDLPTISADFVQMEELFQNLLANAVQYRRPEVKPEIEISAREVENGWEFTVRDNGEGIPAQYQTSVFQPLIHLHAGNSSGTGLGLAICQSIVTRHGGRLWVESEGVGQGASFHFTLPVVEHTG